MSLVKSPELTPEKLAANQANGRQSQGPATPEGVERMRAANTRHGYYSKAPGAEMHLLGEDKKEFEQFCEYVMQAWEPDMLIIARGGSPVGGRDCLLKGLYMEK